MGFVPYYTAKKVTLFLSGIAAGLALPLLMESKPVRKAMASTMAVSMKLKERADAAFETLKEEAEDLYYQAKSRFEEEVEEVEDDELDIEDDIENIVFQEEEAEEEKDED